MFTYLCSLLVIERITKYVLGYLRIKYFQMANLYQMNQDLLLHLTAKDMFGILVVQIEGGGTNYYGKYDVIHGNRIPIPKELAMEVIDMIKEGKICDVEHAFYKDDRSNF